MSDIRGAVIRRNGPAGLDALASEAQAVTRVGGVAIVSDAKRTAALSRDTHPVLGQIDVLTATAVGGEDPALPTVAGCGQPPGRLVTQLANREQGPATAAGQGDPPAAQVWTV